MSGGHAKSKAKIFEFLENLIVDVVIFTLVEDCVEIAIWFSHMVWFVE